MRHKVAHRKLGRVTEHRIALLRNQATALIRHERIETTVPKAKELKPFVERLITIAKRGLAAGEGHVKALNARRLVLVDIQDRAVVGKLFDDIAPRFASRSRWRWCWTAPAPCRVRSSSLPARRWTAASASSVRATR